MIALRTEHRSLIFVAKKVEINHWIFLRIDSTWVIIKLLNKEPKTHKMKL